MHRSFNMIKLYKCDVDNCHNHVKFKHSFCNDCITKIYNNQFRVELCAMCGDSYKILTTDIPEYDEKELFINTLCDSCKKDFFKQLGFASNNANENNEDDDNDNDFNEEDDIEKLF